MHSDPLHYGLRFEVSYLNNPTTKEGDTTAAGGVSARVNLELIFDIGEIEGVKRVEKVRQHQPASFNRQGGYASVVEVAQADQWHRQVTTVRT